jgi:hypothetical protein
LYIESVDLGLNHNGTAFFDDLGLMYIGDGSEQEVIDINGGADCLASGLTYECLGGYDAHYSVDRLQSNGSTLLFSSEDGFGRMFIKDDEGYNSISSSVLVASLASGDSLNIRAYLMAEMVNTFLGYNPSTSLRETISKVLQGNNYPNPFNGETEIQYALTESGLVTIDVYNLSGTIVRHLVNETLLPGSYSVAWDATNENGSLVEDGFYFYRISQGNQAITEKMVLLR